MTTPDKRKAALAALANHARRYKVAIPERLKAFYNGEFDRFDGLYTEGDVAGWGGSTFQLALTPPTWLNKDDDAINGPGGEWEDARHYLPIFFTDQALYVVVKLDDPRCPVGWYHEETWSDGPSPAADSLDEFLAALTETPGTDDKDGIHTPAGPADLDWQEDFGDDGPRAFDAVHDDDDDN